MENIPAIMNIKDPKKFDESGKRIKNLGYASRVGSALAELLKEHGTVEMVALGAGSVNNAVKAICYAQRFLRQDKLDCIATEFRIKEVTLGAEKEGGNVSGRHGKAQSIIVELTQ